MDGELHASNHCLRKQGHDAQNQAPVRQRVTGRRVQRWDARRYRLGVHRLDRVRRNRDAGRGGKKKIGGGEQAEGGYRSGRNWQPLVRYYMGSEKDIQILCKKKCKEEELNREKETRENIEKKNRNRQTTEMTS